MPLVNDNEEDIQELKTDVSELDKILRERNPEKFRTMIKGYFYTNRDYTNITDYNLLYDIINLLDRTDPRAYIVFRIITEYKKEESYDFSFLCDSDKGDMTWH